MTKLSERHEVTIARARKRFPRAIELAPRRLGVLADGDRRAG